MCVTPHRNGSEYIRNQSTVLIDSVPWFVLLNPSVVYFFELVNGEGTSLFYELRRVHRFCVRTGLNHKSFDFILRNKLSRGFISNVYPVFLEKNF